jgi:hypothetical protein
MPFYKQNVEKETISSVIEFFGINIAIFTHLFVKGEQKVELWGGKTLSVKPTVQELAHNIEELIDHMNYYGEIKGINYQFYLN